jgi:FkbM family methyltransferase
MPARPTYVPNRRPGDDHIFDELSHGDYEAKYKLKPGDVVVDAGAHAGFFTSYAAEKVGPGGSVHAFEAEAENFALLRENTVGYANVHRQHLALWSQHEILALNLSHSSAEHSLVYPRLGGQRQTIECRQLDDVLTVPPTFLKIDVEGAELEVLKGASGILSRYRPHIAMELDRKEIARVGAYLMEHSYAIDLRHNTGVFLYGTPF